MQCKGGGGKPPARFMLQFITRKDSILRTFYSVLNSILFFFPFPFALIPKSLFPPMAKPPEKDRIKCWDAIEQLNIQIDFFGLDLMH